MMKKQHSLSGLLIAVLTLTAVVMIGVIIVMYSLFYADMRGTAYRYAEEALGETKRQIETVLADMSEGAMAIVSQHDLLAFASSGVNERLKQREIVRSLLSCYADFKSAALNAYLYTWDGSLISAAPEETDAYSADALVAFMTIKDEYQLTTPFRASIVTDLIHTHAGGVYYALITPVYPAVAAPGASQYLGALVILCQARRLLSFLPVSENHEMLLSESGEVIASTSADFTGVWTQETQSVVMNGQTAPVLHTEINGAPWRLSTLCSYGAIVEQNNRIAMLCTVIILLSLLADGAMLLALYRRVVNPLGNLASQMHTVQGVGARIQQPSGNLRELNILADGMNDMLFRIENLNTELRKSERSYDQEHIMFLQTQINPHFLYNNLECVRGMAAAGDEEKVREMVSCIAAIYRYCNRIEHFATVEEEFACAQVYANILTLRYGERYTLRLTADENTRSCAIPRMVLQPLMENAIRHGFEAHLRKKGSITVTANRDDAALVVRIVDNGGGMDGEMLEGLNSLDGKTLVRNHHIGVDNVQKRLQLLFGHEAILRFSMPSSGGVTVEIRIPQPDKWTKTP